MDGEWISCPRNQKHLRPVHLSEINALSPTNQSPTLPSDQTKNLCRTWTNYAFMVPYIFLKFKGEMRENDTKHSFSFFTPCSHPQIRLHQLSKR